MARRKRRKRSMSEKGGLLSRRRGRRRRGISQGGLILGSGARQMQAGKAVFSGFIGGIGAGYLNRLVGEKTSLLNRVLINGAASFITASLLQRPNMAAGISGAAGLLAQEAFRQGLNEGYDYADPDVLSEYPMFLDEDGNAMQLADDGTMYYLDENGEMVMPAEELMSQGEYQLSDNIYPDSGIYPG